MLWRKMLRELKANFGAFFSVFLLAAIAMILYITMGGHVLSQRVAREAYHKTCNLSDIWMYGEGFSEEQLQKVRALDFVEDAQLRMAVTGTAPKQEDAQVDLYLMRENRVDTPYLMEGEDFDPSDTEGVWLANAFATRRNLKVGDEFTIDYNGISFTKKIRGLVESAEYEFRQADTDVDMYLENIAIAYISYDAFPIREYVEHMVSQGKITPEDIQKNAKDLTSITEQLDKAGLQLSDLTQDILLQLVKNMADEKLVRMMPYTQMIICTKDGGALLHEKEIAESIDYDYAAMIDRDSIPGLARLDSELAQHESFSYCFMVIFVGIAVLVIATSMKRMVEKQRTQIGTLNALGMKKGKILFHYISFSLLVSLLGVACGIWIGVCYSCPWLMGMFAEWYIVPGLHSIFHPIYLIMGGGIVLVCVLSAYLSCRHLLQVRPAEALRPAPPKQGKSCIFEKLPFWSKLPFQSQYNLRDIARAKLRAFMSIVGTMVGMLLMLYGIGCTEFVSTMENLIFEKTTVSEYQVKISSDAALEDVNALNETLDGELVMTDQIEVSKVKNPTSEEKKKEVITVIEGKGYYNILDLHNKVTELKPGSIGVSRKLAEMMDIQVGDTVYWHLYAKNTWYEAKVGMIYRSNETQGIAYLREDYEKTGAAYTPTLLMTNQDAAKYAEKDFVIANNSKQEMIDAYANSMSVMNIMVGVMVLFAVVLIIIVLYNSGSLSFNERIKEFATLKVLGMRSSQIRGLLSRQNFGLSVIGIILGAPLGNMALNVMLNSNGENFDYLLQLPGHSYVISGILVLLVSVFVSFLFAKRIKRLDMIEVLKGVE